jgi:hypothetical protein
MQDVVMWLRFRLERLAWPRYQCVDCIGAGCGREHPCYCAYHECDGPCSQPPGWRRLLRKIIA